jgi:GcrA cell cycle regulator
MKDRHQYHHHHHHHGRPKKVRRVSIDVESSLTSESHHYSKPSYYLPESESLSRFGSLSPSQTSTQQQQEQQSEWIDRGQTEDFQRVLEYLFVDQSLPLKVDEVQKGIRELQMNHAHKTISELTTTSLLPNDVMYPIKDKHIPTCVDCAVIANNGNETWYCWDCVTGGHASTFVVDWKKKRAPLPDGCTMIGSSFKGISCWSCGHGVGMDTVTQTRWSRKQWCCGVCFDVGTWTTSTTNPHFDNKHKNTTTRTTPSRSESPVQNAAKRLSLEVTSKPPSPSSFTAKTLLNSIKFNLKSSDDTDDDNDTFERMSESSIRVLKKLFDNDDDSDDETTKSRKPTTTYQKAFKKAKQRGIYRLNHTSRHHLGRKLGIDHLKEFVVRDERSNDNDGGDRFLFDYSLAVQNLHMIPPDHHYYLELMVRVIQEPDRLSNWTDVNLNPPATMTTTSFDETKPPIMIDELFDLIFSSRSYDDFVEFHHLLYILFGGSVRNDRNLRPYWGLKHWILHGCGVPLFIDSEHSVGAMVAFAFMSGKVQKYVNKVLQLDGGFECLVKALHFEPILQASKMVVQKLGRHADTKGEQSLLKWFGLPGDDGGGSDNIEYNKRTIATMKKENFKLARAIKTGDKTQARNTTMSRIYNKPNESFAPHETPHRLRLLAFAAKWDSEKLTEEFLEKVVTELRENNSIDASNFKNMTTEQILSLDDEWLRQNRWWDGESLPDDIMSVEENVLNTRWSEEEIKKLKSLRAQGLTYAQIAEKLGTGRTAQAVRGKWNALLDVERKAAKVKTSRKTKRQGKQPKVCKEVEADRTYTATPLLTTPSSLCYCVHPNSVST